MDIKKDWLKIHHLTKRCKLKLKQKIGVIGNGFVGGAVKFGFSPQVGCDAEVRVYDKNPSKSTHSIEDTVNKSDFIFLSVPTPANEDGSINLDILEGALKEISEVHNGKDNAILIRSTVIPGTTWALQTKYPNLNILFNPEFLTERSANFDFINQNRFIIGNNGKMGSLMQSESFVELIKDRFGDCVAVMETSYETAELIKYMNNCFFATKVSFMNEMYQIAEKIDANWDEIDLVSNPSDDLLKDKLLNKFKIRKLGNTFSPQHGISLKPYVLLFDEIYTDLYRITEAEEWMKNASKIIFIGTSFSVNITSIALRLAVSRGIEIEIVDPEPIKLDYENIKYFKMTAEQYCEMRQLKN